MLQKKKKNIDEIFYLCRNNNLGILVKENDVIYIDEIFYLCRNNNNLGMLVMLLCID